MTISTELAGGHYPPASGLVNLLQKMTTTSAAG